MAKQTFQEFKREWAEDWATDDVDNAFQSGTREFLIDVITDYYEKDIPNNLKDFREWLVSEKGYDEYDANEYTEGVEDEDILSESDFFQLEEQKYHVEENKKMLFEVKVEVIETHYLSIDANSKEDAEEQAESYSPDPDNAHTVDVNVISIMENETVIKE